MIPTVQLFVKLAILMCLSLQVYASNSFSQTHTPDEVKALQLSRRQLNQQAAEATQGDAAKDAGGKEKGTKEEELAGQMFDTIAQMANGLETLTNLGSSAKEIAEHSKKVQGLIPQLDTAARNLIATAPAKADELNKSFSAAKEAAESLSKSLIAIDQKPEDANLIKENFATLHKSFQTMLTASDDVAIVTVPKIAELAKNEQQTTEGQDRQAEAKPAES